MPIYDLPSLEKPVKLYLPDRLYNYLCKHENEWINGKELEELSMRAGYKGSTAGRDLRLMSEGKMHGKVISKEIRQSYSGRKVKSIWYCKQTSI